MYIFLPKVIAYSPPLIDRLIHEQFPTSLLVKRLQFNRVIPTITFCWGLVCLCTGWVQNFGGLVTVRIFLGFFEGCLFPSMTLFLCNWYTREELGVRVAYLFSKSYCISVQ